MNAALRHEGSDLLLVVHAQPGAKQSAFAGLHGDALKVRLAAPAQDGRANDELRRFLAAAFAVSLGAVILLSGETSRRKRLRIVGVTVIPDAVRAAAVL
ncbi:MAG: DUF167 domain-containing protein [Moraxellaceae bacterium]